MEIVYINYDANRNIFEDEDGTEYKISSIMSDSDIYHYKDVGGVYYFNDLKEYVRYEVLFPSKHLNRSLYYDKASNIFYDELGNLVFNIFDIITSNDLFLFKKRKSNIIIKGIIKDSIIKIIYSFDYLLPISPF